MSSTTSETAPNNGTNKNESFTYYKANNNINNHAVIVSSSRYWFNYRHAVNALVFYQMVKSNGIPDENIILMLADDLPSNARNPHKNSMYNAGITASSLYDASTEIDYRGEDVTVQNMVRALLGRQSNSREPVLHTDENSNILIYLTGHGGDQFFKFQDIEEITADEIASTLAEMHVRRKYNQVLLVADTCQAYTLGDGLSKTATPNVMVVGSSLKGESSYAHHSDVHVGMSVIEKYTHAFLQFVDTTNNPPKSKNKRKQNNNNNNNNQKDDTVNSNTTMPAFASLTIQQAMIDQFPYSQQRAHIGFRDDLMEREVDTIQMGEFFMNNQLYADATNKEGEGEEESKLISASLLLSVHLPEETLAFTAWSSKESRAEKHERIQSPVWNRWAQPTNEVVEIAATRSAQEDFVLDPSDGFFLGLVALLVGVVLVVSRQSSPSDSSDGQKRKTKLA